MLDLPEEEEHRAALPSCSHLPYAGLRGDVGQRIWQQELLNRGSEANRKWRVESCFMKPSPRLAPDDWGVCGKEK